MTDFPESKRTVFKPITLDDVEFLRSFYSDERNTKYIPLPILSIGQLVENRISHWKKHGFGTYIVYLKPGGQKIGYCGIEYIGDSGDPDIRYGLISDSWGGGLGKEVAHLVIDMGFTSFGLMKIWGAAEPANVASIRILKSLGMTADHGFQHYGDVVEGYSIEADTWSPQLMVPYALHE